MRIVLLFAPNFLAFGKMLMNDLREKQPGLEVIGLASSKRVHDALKDDKSLEFICLECVDERERLWLNTSYNEERLKAYEKALGSQVINNILIADRLAGSGFISCANKIDTELQRRSRDDCVMRAYVTEMLHSIDQLYEQYKPDAAFVYTIAGAYGYALSEVLRTKNVPVCRMQHTRIEDRFIIVPETLGGIGPVWSRYEQGEKPGKDALEKARAYLNDVRKSSDKKPDYFNFSRSKIKNKMSWAGAVKNIGHAFARMVLYRFLRNEKPVQAESGVQKFIESFTVPWQTLKMGYFGKFADLGKLERKGFIFYTLHVDPEASTMVLAPDYTDQMAVIEALAKRKPLHMQLVVKEHPNMIGRRPPGFYKRIQALPGVCMVHPGIPSYDLVKQAGLVATISGTVAWEAMLAGTPALVLGEFPYLGFGKGVMKGTYNTLGRDIEKARDLKPVPDKELERFLGLLFEETFSLPSRVFWSQPSDETVAKHPDIVDNMSSQFLRRCRESGVRNISAAA